MAQARGAAHGITRSPLQRAELVEIVGVRRAARDRSRGRPRSRGLIGCAAALPLAAAERGDRAERATVAARGRVVEGSSAASHGLALSRQASFSLRCRSGRDPLAMSKRTRRLLALTPRVLRAPRPAAVVLDRRSAASSAPSQRAAPPWRRHDSARRPFSVAGAPAGGRSGRVRARERAGRRTRRGRAAHRVEPALRDRASAGGRARAGLPAAHPDRRDALARAAARQGRPARVLRHLVSALRRRGAPPGAPLAESASGALRDGRGERRRRDGSERARLPHLLRARLPGAPRPERAPGQLPLPGGARSRLEGLPRRELPHLLRPRRRREGRLGRRRRAAGPCCCAPQLVRAGPRGVSAAAEQRPTPRPRGGRTARMPPATVERCQGDAQGGSRRARSPSARPTRPSAAPTCAASAASSAPTGASSASSRC